jgi:hypothetical protein
MKQNSTRETAADSMHAESLKNCRQATSCSATSVPSIQKQDSHETFYGADNL